MTACIGSAAILMDWTHERTPESDEIQYVSLSLSSLARLARSSNELSNRIIATLFPKDGCRLKFTPRSATA